MFNVNFKDKVRHVMNPMHIYSRICDVAKVFHIPVDRKKVKQFCLAYEQKLYRPVLGVSQQPTARVQ